MGLKIRTVGHLTSCKMAARHWKYSPLLCACFYRSTFKKQDKGTHFCSSYWCRSSFSRCQWCCDCVSHKYAESSLSWNWVYSCWILRLYRRFSGGLRVSPVMWFTWLHSSWPITLCKTEASRVVLLLCHWALHAPEWHSSPSSMTSSWNLAVIMWIMVVRNWAKCQH